MQSSKGFLEDAVALDPGDQEGSQITIAILFVERVAGELHQRGEKSSIVFLTSVCCDCMHQVPLVFILHIAEVLQEVPELASIQNFFHDLNSLFESFKVTSLDTSVHFKVDRGCDAFGLLTIIVKVFGTHIASMSLIWCYQ